MSKKLKISKTKIDRMTQYPLEDAVDLLKEISYARFDESVDIAVSLGVDPRKSDQMVRGTAVLPNGTGKEVRVLVFAKGEKEMEAREAGADFVGAEDLVEKIKGGWLDFDKAIATPDIMSVVSKIGKILGPRGLMPNPKLGTVTFDIAKAVKEIKAGKVEYRVDKGGIIHVPIGKVSFDSKKLIENIQTVIDSLNKAKPSASKGKYFKKMSISSTMGPGIPVDIQKIAYNLKK